jgi:thioredoxin 1
VIDELSTEMSDKVKIVKMNIDENPNTPSELGVKGIPALMLFKDGEKIGSEVGNKPKNTISDWINSLI